MHVTGAGPQEKPCLPLPCPLENANCAVNKKAKCDLIKDPPKRHEENKGSYKICNKICKGNAYKQRGRTPETFNSPDECSKAYDECCEGLRVAQRCEECSRPDCSGLYSKTCKDGNRLHKDKVVNFDRHAECVQGPPTASEL